MTVTLFVLSHYRELVRQSCEGIVCPVKGKIRLGQNADKGVDFYLICASNSSESNRISRIISEVYKAYSE